MMWTREAECEEVIEMAWDSYREDLDLPIQDRLIRCQQQLMQWNQTVFGNVNKTLKQKQNLLQQLEALNSLNESKEEISALRKEINKVLIGKSDVEAKVKGGMVKEWGQKQKVFPCSR